MTSLILVRGLPGAGKSTFAHAYAAKMLAESREPATTLSADDYFTDQDGDYHWDPRLLAQAHRSCQERTFHALDYGNSAIVANTFSTKKEFEPYLRMIDRGGGKEGRRVAGVSLGVFSLFDAGLSDRELAERNVHGVPEHTIAKMRDRWVKAPVPEVHVHIEGAHAYWQYPSSDWVELEINNNG